MTSTTGSRASSSGPTTTWASPSPSSSWWPGIRALARRAAAPVPPVLTHGDITLDPSRRLASRAGQPLGLTRKELAVLEVLLSAGGAVVSAEDLLERVWDEHADPFTNTIRVTVMNLRRKLGDPPVIHTVVGSGYRL